MGPPTKYPLIVVTKQLQRLGDLGPVPAPVVGGGKGRADAGVVQCRFNDVRQHAQLAQHRRAGAPQVVPVPVTGSAGLLQDSCLTVPIAELPTRFTAASLGAEY